MTLVRNSFSFFLSFTSPFRIHLVETSYVILDHFHEYIIVAHLKTFKYRMCFINFRYSDSIFLLNPSAIVFLPTSFPARFGEKGIFISTCATTSGHH